MNCLPLNRFFKTFILEIILRYSAQRVFVSGRGKNFISTPVLPKYVLKSLVARPHKMSKSVIKFWTDRRSRDDLTVLL